MLPETPGFVAAMDAAGPWQPVGIALAMSEPNGPVEHDFFEELLATIERRLTAALPVDGVYICAHGAAVTTEEDDPEGVLFEMVRAHRRSGRAGRRDLRSARQRVGPHGRYDRRLYRLPHEPASRHARARRRGGRASCANCSPASKTERVRVRLPIVPPTVTLLTAAGPYAEMIELGQRRQAEIGPAIINVSVMGGFAYCRHREERPHRRRDRAPRRARDARLRWPARSRSYGWDNRARFYPTLTSLDEAVAEGARGGARSGAAGARASPMSPTIPAAAGAATRCTCCAPSPRPGSRGRCSASSTTRRSPPRRTATGCTTISTRVSIATRRRISPSPGPRRRAVAALSDGNCVGRRGIYAGLRLALGPCAALAIGGITVVVVSHRVQCADPIFFEMMGLDIGKARVVAVKSRGHFRGGFDEFFGPDQIVEVDLPGLTSPMLNRFDWTRLPRPVIPLDEGVEFSLT